MAKQKAKTVDMSVSVEELDKIILPEDQAKEAEKTHLKELKEAEKAEKEAKKLTKKTEKAEIQEKIEEKAKEVKIKTKGVRSKRYQAARVLIDRTKTYELKKAITLLTKTSYSAFTGTVVTDLIVKDDKTSAELTFPHSTGKTTRVAIATDELLAQVDKGNIDFDILLADPKMMAKIAKYAKILGPKGLMPNPKNGTITADPQKRQKELSGGKFTVKTEKKAPLMHVVVGKTDFKETQLVENVDTLIKAIGAKKIIKLVLSATMSPGIKVDLTPYQTI